MARGGDGLKAEELKQGPHEDVRACAEDVGPQKSVPLGAAGFRHVVKHAHRLLQQQLEPARHHLEPGDHKDADAGRRNQQNGGDRHGGDETGVDVLPAQQADLVLPVQNGIPHGDLDGLRLARRGRQQAAREQDHDEQNPKGHEFFMAFHAAISFLSVPGNGPCVCALIFLFSGKSLAF
mgnify:CR=1 FL=1